MDKIDGLTPTSQLAALARLGKFVDVMMPYRLGSGGYRRGTFGTAADQPWTTDTAGVVGCDCWGAIKFAFGLVGHRPGFNVGNDYGRWDILDVTDDINANSAIGDARHRQELFVEVPSGAALQIGDVLTYPTIMLPNSGSTDWLRDDAGEVMKWIGHGQLVKSPVGVRVGGPYSNAEVIQCYGPSDRRPAIRITDGSAMDHHDERWPKSEHRTTVLRIHPRFRMS